MVVKKGEAVKSVPFSKATRTPEGGFAITSGTPPSKVSGGGGGGTVQTTAQIQQAAQIEATQPTGTIITDRQTGDAIIFTSGGRRYQRTTTGEKIFVDRQGSPTGEIVTQQVQQITPTQTGMVQEQRDTLISSRDQIPSEFDLITGKAQISRIERRAQPKRFIPPSQQEETSRKIEEQARQTELARLKREKVQFVEPPPPRKRTIAEKIIFPEAIRKTGIFKFSETGEVLGTVKQTGIPLETAILGGAAATNIVGIIGGAQAVSAVKARVAKKVVKEAIKRVPTVKRQPLPLKK